MANTEIKLSVARLFDRMVSFEMENLGIIYGEDHGASSLYQNFWSEIIPKSIRDEPIRYCESPQKVFRAFSLWMSEPSNAQITAYQLAMTVFGSDAVSGMDSYGYTILTLDGQQLKLKLSIDTAESVGANFVVFPIETFSAKGLDAAIQAGSSVLAHLKEHHIEYKLAQLYPTFKFLDFLRPRGG